MKPHHIEQRPDLSKPLIDSNWVSAEKVPRSVSPNQSHKDRILCVDLGDIGVILLDGLGR